MAQNWPLLYQEMVGVGQASKESLAGFLGTLAIETGSTMQPVAEAYFLGSWAVAEAWRRANLRYYPYYGRGFIQITWEENYRTYGVRFGVDLVGNPDLAMEPSLSAKIAAAYWGDRNIQAAAQHHDWTKVRLQVQGGDGELARLISIAERLLA